MAEVQAASSTQSRDSRGLVRLLIVDDDRIMTLIIEEFASERGCKVFCAANCAEAMQRFDDCRPHVLLIDFQLPDGTGLGLLRQLRERSAPRWFPALVISAHNDPSIVKACFDGGADDYLTKPLDMAMLEAKVRALWRVASLQHQLDRQTRSLQHYYEASEAENSYAQYLYRRLTERGLNAPVGVQSWVQSSTNFSGDVVLFERGRNGDFYALLADATGHGLAAAISLIPLVQSFLAMSAKGFQLASIVAEMNRMLRGYVPPERFVAALVLQISPVRKSLTVWNGGIPPPLWLNADGSLCRELRSRHLPLGLLRPEEFNPETEHWSCVEPGYLLCLSDGVLEAENPEAQFFGRERLDEVLASTTPASLFEALRQRLTDFSAGQFRDDVSIALLDLHAIHPPAAAEASGTPLRLIPPCQWELSLSGAQIADVDVVPLSLNWLQAVGVGESLCQRLYTLLSELISNAVDHGILGLGAELKNQEDGFGKYVRERESRLALIPAEARLTIQLQIAINDGAQQIRLRVLDSGHGFTPAKLSCEELTQRGLSLVRRLSDSVEFLGAGNEVLVTLAERRKD